MIAPLLLALLQCNGGGGGPNPTFPPFLILPRPPRPETPDVGPTRPAPTGPTGLAPTEPGPAALGPRTGAFGPRTAQGLDLGPALDWQDWWWLNAFDYLKPLARRPLYTPGGDDLGAESPREEAERQAAIGLFAAALRDPDARVRATAALSGGRLGLRHDLLRDLLRDGNPDVRRSAIGGLALAGVEENVPLLLRLGRGDAVPEIGTASLEERDLSLLALGIAGLRGSSNRFAIPLRAFLAQSSTNDLRLLGPSAATSLALAGDPGAIDGLAAIAVDRETEPALRARALWAFRAARAVAHRDAVLACLEDKNVDVRRAAVLALGRLGEGEEATTAETLRRFVESEGDVAARAFAMIALGEIGGEPAKRELLRRLVHGKQQFRPWAALGAGILARAAADPEVGRVLARALAEERNRDTRAAIALAVGLSRSPEGREWVRRLVVEGENGRERVFAAIAVALAADEDGVEPLRRAMREIPNPIVRASDALALSVFRNPSDAPAMIEVFEACESPETLSTAALALAWNGSAKALERLRREIEASPRPERRAAALLALGLGLAPEKVPVSVAATAGWNFLASLEASHAAAALWL